MPWRDSFWSAIAIQFIHKGALFMKSIINGKTYNTETSARICSLPCACGSGDFWHHKTDLYQTPKGSFFLAGHGGPRSMWAEQTGQNEWSSGAGIKLLSDQEARSHMESAGCEPQEFENCGLTLEEG
jgi:hypothetical protein